MLHELDREIERQGLRFVRYADDFSIYCKTKQDARTAGNAIFLFLKHKLKLEINRDKSGIRRPVHFQILGYGFVPVYRSIQQKLVEIDGWLRNRLRYCIWTDWKNPEKKRRSLIRLGVEPSMAYAWSRTSSV